MGNACAPTSENVGELPNSELAGQVKEAIDTAELAKQLSGRYGVPTDEIDHTKTLDSAAVVALPPPGTDTRLMTVGSDGAPTLVRLCV